MAASVETRSSGGATVTVCLGYRIPGVGAVLACDGRITDGSSNDILSDNEKKYAICGNMVVLVAGTFGKLWNKIQTSPPKSFTALRMAINDHMGDDSEWLVYSKSEDRLYLGDMLVSRPIAGIGCGSAFGLGALEALPLAKTLEAAQQAVSTAMAIACRRNASCGGRIRLITIPKKGQIKIGTL